MNTMKQFAGARGAQMQIDRHRDLREQAYKWQERKGRRAPVPVAPAPMPAAPAAPQSRLADYLRARTGTDYARTQGQITQPFGWLTRG